MARAKATCTCATCGASFEKIEYKRNSKEASSYEAWAVENCVECPDCYHKRMEEERANRIAALGLDDLPELTGTEKQVAWANKLRVEWIDKIIAEGNRGGERKRRIAVDFVRFATKRVTKASEWIDTRGDWTALVKLYRDEYIGEKKAAEQLTSEI